MKRLVCLLLTILLVSPAFATWLPHDALHALHKNNIEHYTKGSHTHSHEKSHHHDHTDDIHSSDHHDIHFDITTYYSDFLNVDLHRTSQARLTLPTFDLSDFNLALAVYTEVYSHFHLAPDKHFIHLHWKAFYSSEAPPYLVTQRLRI